MNKKPHILFIQRDDGGCGFYRCQQPANFIRRMGLADTEVVFRKASNEQLLSADLVVFQDMGTEEASGRARFCRENKIPYICEFDDFVQHVSPFNKGGYDSWNPGTLFAHRAMVMASNADAITVSTNQLAREYFAYNPFVYVVPNYLDKERWTFPISKKTDGKIRIGWMGGNAHRQDLEMISQVINKIVKEGKGMVVFETFGMTETELSGVFSIERQNETCKKCLFEGGLRIHPGETLDHYPMIMASKGWNIAVAPVIKNSFGLAKSDVKIKEYSTVGLPIVASPIFSYQEASVSGAQISFAETFDEWYNILNDLVKDKKRREEQGRINKEWSEKNWIQDNAQNIFEVYKQVMDRARAINQNK